jgi:alkylation response protein AidB-like acyl-CoA dehydrogenase
VLTDEMLQRFQQRAPGYDQENRFFTEDFEELKEAGYLLMAVPREMGGMGMSMTEVCKEQRRLGYYAPADALAVNMHLYWTGIAADLHRAGDHSLDWLLRAAADGEVFAAGHAESGNDIPVLLSTTKAERVEGGYRFTGRKHFSSLTPVWTYLGVHGMDMSDPAHPMIIHAFIPRETEGLKVVDTWDVLGMRATRSDDTILDGAFVPDRFISRKVAAGAAGLDQFVLGIFAWALMGFGNIYYGLARRALDLTVETVKRRRRSGSPVPCPTMPECSTVSRRWYWSSGHRAAPRRGGGGLVGRGELRRGLGDQDHLGQASCGRGLLAGGGSGLRSGRWVRDLPSGTVRGGCCATRDWDGFTRRTRCSPMSWRRS